jgi:hypothetical protein
MTNLNAIKDLVTNALDIRKITAGQERMKLVCAKRSPDYAPLILGYSQPFVGNSKDKGNDPWPEPQKTMDLWHKIQDDVFPRS